MPSTVIRADIKNVRVKVPTRGARGTVGVIYTPKEWVGKTVYIVLDAPSASSQAPSAAPGSSGHAPEVRPERIHNRHLKKKRLRNHRY